MKDDNSIEIQSGEWTIKESDKLVAKYKECKTDFAKAKILPKLISIGQKLKFECSVVSKLIKE